MEKSAKIFRFKKFDVVNERSAMKVNTDGVLLGALMTIRSSDRCLLDIGTGTGTIALMAAQRLAGMYVDGDHRWAVGQNGTSHPCSVESSVMTAFDKVYDGAVRIDAIDIDGASAAEAEINFRNSPWSEILHAHHISLDEFASSLTDSDALAEEMVNGHSHSVRQKYDLIFSNPPYFDCSLQAPEERRNAARHTATGLSYREILEFAALHLAPEGRLALVLPADSEKDMTRWARMCGLHLSGITRVRTVPRKNPSRIVTEFTRRRAATVGDAILTIQNEGQYTEEYLSLMREFYLFA